MKRPKESNWVSEFSIAERQRREDFKIAREAVMQFVKLLSDQIHEDIYAYYREFPEEAAYIETADEQGESVVIRTRDQGSTYSGLPCSVRFQIEINELRLYCRFTHRQELNRTFALAIDSNGGMSLADGSISDLTRYLLMPVLFNKLRLGDPGNSPEGN